MRSFIFSIAVSIASLAMTSSTSLAASCTSVPGNLIVNCGFESGTMSGWTLTGNTTNPPGGFNGSGYGLDAPDANSGSFGVYIGPIGSTMSLSQNIAVTANTQYSITFNLNPNTKPYIHSNHTLVAEIDNIALTTTLVPLVVLSDPVTVGAYVPYTYAFSLTSAQLGGTSGQVAVLFTFRNDDDYWSFDDISVTPTGVLIAKTFSPSTIQTGDTSVVTLTLTNNNTFMASGGAFTDTLANMSAAGGAVSGTCTGTSPATLSAGQTALSFSGITIPPTSSCTVIFSVTSSTAGVQPNTTSGVTITQTGTAGPPSNTANLTVLGPPTISKAFSPTTIQSGSTSVVTLTLSNSNATALTGGAFTDTLANMSAAGSAVSGTCSGTTPATLAAGQTALSFSGITIPASASCTVTFGVTSTVAGIQPNRTSGVTTAQTTTAGSASNIVSLTVVTPPTISKAFNPSTIQTGANSVVTLTLANSNAADLTGAAFTDALVNMSALGGSVTGTCIGTSPGSLTAGQTALSLSGITVPANSNCTVIFSVTSNIQGVQNNTTSGATTTQTSIAGPASNTATLTVLMAPTISKAFSPTSIQSGDSSVVTLTLSNSNSTNLTGGAFSDTLVNMTAAGGAVTGSCAGTLPGTLSSGQTIVSFNGITIPANSNCTVVFSVTSTTQGAQNNTTSGVFTNQTTTAGPASNTATLTVFVPPTVSKSFNPTVIAPGGTSVVTVSISNSNGVPLGGGSFLDTLVNMSAVGGPVTGSCVGTSPNTLPAGQTLLTFVGITIPAGSCSVKFSVTSSTLGQQSNTTSGVTSVQTPTPGSGSNTATLTVVATPTIVKAFSPTTIQLGGTSTVTLTLANSSTATLVNGAFTDTLANMSAVAGAVGGTCVGTTPSSLTAGQTALSFSGITIPTSGSCTVIFSVTSSTPGIQPNTTSGITTAQTAVGTGSNTATLTVLSAPSIAKGFNPTSIGSGGSSVVTLTLTNSNAPALSGGAFTDALVNMSAVGGAVGGTCAGTTPSSLTAGQTALSFSGITIPGSGNCTVTFSVTSTNIGGNPNTTSGVTTTQTATAGTISNTASLTVTALALPTIATAFSPSTMQAGGTSTVTLTLANSTASALTGGAFSDALVNMSAVGGAVGGTCAGTTPVTLTAGQTNLSFSGITIPASGSCTVSFAVTSSTTGALPNTTSGVTTTQTTAGTGSNTAVLTVLSAPTIAKNFNPASIASGGTSVVTLMLSNGNGSALTGGAFTDTLVNMSAIGGVAGGTCGAGSSLTAGQTALSFSGITIPVGGCTVTFNVSSSHAGGNNNTTSGVSTTQTPIAGAASNTAVLTVTTQTAVVTDVTSSTANGSYKAGSTVSIQVSFGATVNVSGTPTLALNSGGIASYAGGSGSNTLSFNYTVASPQSAPHLDYTSTSALTLNGGTITDAGAALAVLTLPAPGAAASLGANKNIVIDTTAPSVVSYSVLYGGKSFNMAGSARNRLPWLITGIQVVFSEPVNATAAGLSGLIATGVSGSGTNTVTWNLNSTGNLPATVTTILGTTVAAVTDIAGNPLGGGVNFNQTLKVLYGDFNDDGTVNSQDLALVNGARLQPYNIFADLNGDGAVDPNDVLAVRAQVGNSNP